MLILFDYGAPRAFPIRFVLTLLLMVETWFGAATRTGKICSYLSYFFFFNVCLE